MSGISLPPLVDGTWEVELNVLTLKGLGGLGLINLPNGRTLTTSMASRFSKRTGLSLVHLLGYGTSRGSTLNIKYFVNDSTRHLVSGQVMGQTVASSLTQDGGVLQELNVALLSQVGQTNPTFAGASCMDCHGAMVITASTGRHTKVGVQCEACHGPTANHIASPYDPASRPTNDLSGTVCSTCHNGPEHPIYDEWKASPHVGVVPVVAMEMAASTNLVDSCGRCHSGSERLSLLNHDAPPANPADTGISCAVCHEPHAAQIHTNLLSGVIAFTNILSGRGFVITNSEVAVVYTNQIRNPFASTNDYFIITSGAFSNQYDPSINICAQCHNHRGASWTDNTRSPHPSLQYQYAAGYGR